MPTFRHKGVGLYVPADVPALLRSPEIWPQAASGPGEATQCLCPPCPSSVPPSVAPHGRADVRWTGEAADLRRAASEHAAYFSAKSGVLPPPRESDRPPWIEPPAGAEPFEFVAAIPTPAAGVTAVVLQFGVPYGYDGVIRRVSHNYTGGGFVQGSGDLVWRLFRDGAAVRNFESLTIEFGSIQTPRPIDAIRIFSGQVITYEVEHSASSGLPVAGTQIVCALGGYFYPTGEERR